MCARRGASPLLPISAVRARPQALIVLALLAAVAAALFPSAAFGQSAGDEQYSDPFGEQEQQQATQQPETPAQPVEQPAETAPAETTGEEAPAPAQSSDPSLPVTGLPALVLLALGAGMLATGLLVRRRA